MFNKIRRAAFDNFNGKNSYDPDYMNGQSFGSDTQSTNNYDPDFADAPAPGQNPTSTTTVRTANPGQKMQINLQLNNPSASKITFDLFNAFNSAANIFQPELPVAGYTMIPLNSYEGSIIAAPKNGTIGFTQDGSLYMRGGGADPVVTLGCTEYPYASLLDTTKVLGFKIVVIRVSVATQAQFNNNITYRLRSYAGVKLDNEINVRSYKRLINPAQLDIDVKAGVVVTGEAGLRYALEAGESVQLGLYINRWAKPSL